MLNYLRNPKPKDLCLETFLVNRILGRYIASPVHDIFVPTTGVIEVRHRSGWTLHVSKPKADEEKFKVVVFPNIQKSLLEKRAMITIIPISSHEDVLQAFRNIKRK